MKKFKVSNITTWGLEQDRKYGGYKLPVSFKYEPDVVSKIESQQDRYSAKNVFYGESKTLYLRVFELTKKQREELLEKGRQKIDLSFKINGTSKSDKTGFTYLNFKVTGLKRSETSEDLAPSDTI